MALQFEPGIDLTKVVFLDPENENLMRGPCQCGKEGSPWLRMSLKKSDKITRVKKFECDRCYYLSLLADYQQSKVLTTRLMSQAALERYHQENGRGVRYPWTDAEYPMLNEINESVDRIVEVVKEFTKTVWQGGLQKMNDEATVAGHSFKGKGFKILSMESAGRFLMTISDGKKNGPSISLIAIADDPAGNMGIQGIDATEEQAKGFIQMALKKWAAGRLPLKPDKDVRVGF